MNHQDDSPDELAAMSEAQLASLITYHNRKYWEDGEPEISDDNYDLLVRALTRLNPRHPLLSQVQAPLVAGNGKVHHVKPMLSLDKAYSLEEVLAWGAKYARNPEEPLLIQPKYDGISALWSNRVLATRGDGEIGEDISDKAVLIELEHPDGVMPLLSFSKPARGEIVIREDDFKSLYPNIRNRNGRSYKNSRNAVAGIMGLKEIREMVLQKAKLTLVDYSLFSWHSSLQSLKDDWPEILLKAEALPYPMDGLVIKLADVAYSDSLGNTAHHPRGQIAFKFSGVRSVSRLLNVEWSFGKNCLTPVAEIEPVEIGGTTIRRASLHNLQNILEKDLQIGDQVTVERAGDVIPYIVSSEPGENRRSCLIETCPSCGAALVRKLPELCCVNPDCFETQLQRLLAAVKNIGIERLGEPNLRKLMQCLQVRKLSDLFRLTVADLLRLDGFQRVSANNLYQEIQSARQVPDWQILASLNLRGIGPNIAKSILTVYSIEELRQKTVEELSRLDGIGPERAGTLFGELRAQSELIDELLSNVEVIASKGDAGSMKTICFTGKMPEKRSYYEAMAAEHGYSPADSVSSSLSLLVAADTESSSGKIDRARKYGVRVVSLADWLEEISEKGKNVFQTEVSSEVSQTQSGDEESWGMHQGSFSF